MNLNKYTVFTKTLEMGSVTAAAGSLGVTQSAATQLIAALEKDFDCKLLRRNKAGVSLTREGKFLLPYVKDVLDANKILDAAVTRLHQDSNIIKIANQKSKSNSLISVIVDSFAAKNPEVKIELVNSAYTVPAGSDKAPDYDFTVVPVSEISDFPSLQISDNFKLVFIANAFATPIATEFFEFAANK